MCNLISHPDLQVKVSFLYPENPTWAELECRSMCGLAGDTPYIWIRNGQNVGQGINYWEYIQSDGSYSCAVEGYERVTSPLVCKFTPQYTDMIPDVMDLLEYITMVTMNDCRAYSKRACSERADGLASCFVACSFPGRCSFIYFFIAFLRLFSQ